MRKKGWWYSLTPLPGNHEVMVSHDSFLMPLNRGKGLGQELHTKRIEQAKESYCSYMLATVESNNAPQIHIMSKNGWKELDSFTSNCTLNKVIIFGKAL